MRARAVTLRPFPVTEARRYGGVPRKTAFACCGDKMVAFEGVATTAEQRRTG